MSVPRELTCDYAISKFYLNQNVRDEVEPKMVAELAQQAHRAGLKFGEWPRITAIEDHYFDSIRLTAKVWVIPR